MSIQGPTALCFSRELSTQPRRLGWVNEQAFGPKTEERNFKLTQRAGIARQLRSVLAHSASIGKREQH